MIQIVLQCLAVLAALLGILGLILLVGGVFFVLIELHIFGSPVDNDDPLR